MVQNASTTDRHMYQNEELLLFIYAYQYLTKELTRRTTIFLHYLGIYDRFPYKPGIFVALQQGDINVIKQTLIL